MTAGMITVASNVSTELPDLLPDYLPKADTGTSESVILAVSVSATVLLLIAVVIVIIARVYRGVHGKTHEDLSRSLDIYAIRSYVVEQGRTGESSVGESLKGDSSGTSSYNEGLRKNTSNAHLFCD